MTYYLTGRVEHEDRLRILAYSENLEDLAEALEQPASLGGYPMQLTIYSEDELERLSL